MTRLAPLLLAMLTCIACVGSKDSEAPDSSSHSLAFDGDRIALSSTNELKPIDFEPIDARDLPPNAAAFYEKKRTVDEHTLSLFRTVIDGEPVFVVRQMIQKEDGMRQTGFLFDARSFVVAPGQESAEGRTPITFALTDPASDP